MPLDSNNCEFSQKNYSRWKEHSTKCFSNYWFNILEKDSYYSVEHLEEQVMVLAVVEHCSILLIKAKRDLLGQSIWELPAGGINKGEKPSEAASRELFEETGISIENTERFIPQASFILASNRMPMFPYIFHLNLRASELKTGFTCEKEIESVDHFKFNVVKKMIAGGEIFTTLPIAVISRFLIKKSSLQ